MSDNVDFMLGQLLDFSADYIHNAMKSGGNILVHCQKGQSRSVILAMAYLIKYEKMSFEQAFQTLLQASDDICPNIAFTHELKNWSQQF